MKVNLLEIDEHLLEDVNSYIMNSFNEDIHNDYILSKFEISKNTILFTFLGNRKILFKFSNIKIISLNIIFEQIASDVGVVEHIQKYSKTLGFDGPPVRDFRIDFVGDSFIEFSADEAWLEIF